MTAVLAAVAGAILVAGVLLVVAGLFPALAPAPAPHRTATTHPRSLPAGSTTRIVVAVAGAGVAWLVTGWPVAALIVAATVWGLPILLGTSTVAAAGIDRIEALEEWTRRLSDVLVVGVGLEQGIAATVRTCPQRLHGEVSALAARLDARWPTEAALRAFADDLDDATGDLVVATLILGARRRGPGLARVLAAVADSVAEEVAMRRRVEAERAKPRTTARAVTLITLGVVAVGALNGTYLAPYGTLLGQLVLAVIACGFIASLAWMRALTLTRPQPRLFQPTGATSLGDAADPARTQAAAAGRTSS
jgi:Flp pilus assembly protein TadB